MSWIQTHHARRGFDWQYRRRFAIIVRQANLGTLRKFTVHRCAPPRIPPFTVRRIERLYGPL